MPKYQLELKYDNEDKIRERKAILLDTNAWIDLAERDEIVFKQIRSKLIHLVEHGKVFCPLSLEIFSEFHRQTYESIKRLFPIIDCLTLNLTLKNRQSLIKLEIRNFIDNILNETNKTIPRNEIFVPFVCVKSNDLSIDFPHSFKHPMAKPFFRNIHEIMINWKFSEYMSDLKSRVPQYVDVGSQVFTDEWVRRYELTKGNKKKMYEMEEDGMIEDIIKPIFLEEVKGCLMVNKSKVSNMIRFFNEIDNDINLKAKKISKNIIENCPFLRNTLEVLTFAGFDIKRKGRKTDYEDLEIMIESTSYYDALLTADKWIYGLLTANKTRLQTNTVFYQDYNDFDVFLDTLLN